MDNTSPLDIAELINSLKITQRGPNEQLAKNVVMTLAAKVLEAQFGSELAFVGRPGKATVSKLDADTNATYTRGTGNIAVSPYANNNNQTMYMTKQKDGSYLGNFYGNPTTADVLDMVATMRHELYHARRDQDGGTVKGGPLQKLFADDNRANMIIDTITKRNLPSVESAIYPIEEFLATAVPLINAESKLGTLTRKQKRFKDEVDMVIHSYPEMAKVIGDMSRPELLTK